MGHVIFAVLHVVCLAVFLPGLLLTIPLHLIYAAVRPRRRPEDPSPWTHVRCPACRGFADKEAEKCPHCGTGLVPASRQ